MTANTEREHSSSPKTLPVANRPSSSSPIPKLKLKSTKLTSFFPSSSFQILRSQAFRSTTVIETWLRNIWFALLPVFTVLACFPVPSLDLIIILITSGGMLPKPQYNEEEEGFCQRGLDFPPSSWLDTHTTRLEDSVSNMKCFAKPKMLEIKCRKYVPRYTDLVRTPLKLPVMNVNRVKLRGFVS